MDCIMCCTSASAFSSASLVSRANWRFPERFLYVGNSPSFRSVSSSPRTAATVSPAAALVLCSSAFETKDFPFPDPRGEESGSQDLSAKERRKLRNDRRQAAKVAQEQPWKTVVEDRLLEKKQKIRNWREDADINRCIAKGVQWWMLQTTRKYEFDVAEQIEIIFPEAFPGREFQVCIPTVPVKTKLKDGSVSQARKKLYEGIVLLRCLLDRDVYFTIKKIPRAYEFFGTQAGLSLQPIVMPAPVSNFNMDVMFQKIKKQEEEYEEFKEQCRIELEEQKQEKQRNDKEQHRRDAEQKILESQGPVLGVGSTVRILSGPFMHFTGVVIELLPNNKIKAIVTIFGNNDKPVVLDKEEVALESAMMYRP